LRLDDFGFRDAFESALPYHGFAVQYRPVPLAEARHCSKVSYEQSGNPHEKTLRSVHQRRFWALLGCAVAMITASATHTARKTLRMLAPLSLKQTELI
jgi:hypothetical protein